MNRIQISDTDGSNVYTFVYNPDTYDAVDSANMVLVNVLDGSPARISGTFDNRMRSMSWPAYPVTNTSYMGMVNVLKGYKGLEKKINLKDVDAPFSYGWRYIKIVDVITELQQGGDLRLKMTLNYVYTQNYAV